MSKKTLTPLWERIEGKNGFRPLFEIKCRFCGEQGFDIPLIIRYSHIFLTPNPVYDALKPTCQVGYKCPRCGWVPRFNIQDDVEYLKELMELRKDKDGTYENPYTPPVEEWIAEDDENKKIEEQLEALGYVGGRG